jgi:hypothetical protein
MYLGEKEIKECPHKTVSRSYNSPSSASAQWRCDWCGQEFSLAVGATKTVEINEVKPPHPGDYAQSSERLLIDATQAERLRANSAKKKEKSYVG